MTTFNEMIRSGNFVVLDTETTGLGPTAEICQIAVINDVGHTVMNTLVKPVNAISPGAMAVHHITDDMVKDAPGWAEVSQQLVPILQGKNVVIYNAVFDRKLMHQSAEQCRMEKIEWKSIATFHCAMLRFAEIYGDWNDYYQSYRWQTLATACKHYGVIQVDAHTALGDCLATLAICTFMSREPVKE